MNVWTFIAVNCPLYEIKPSEEYPLEINVDAGTIFYGDADENFFV